VFGTDGVKIEGDMKTALLEQIQRRLTPKAVKVRADIELTCFHYEGTHTHTHTHTTHNTQHTKIQMLNFYTDNTLA